MTVYVDALRDWGWSLGPSCHMTSDNIDELHAIANKIGLKRSWFQDKNKNHLHYDLVKSKRKLAIKYGALEVCDADYIKIVKKCHTKNELNFTITSDC